MISTKAWPMSAAHVEIEPGDLTKYRFIIALEPTGYLAIAAVEGPRFDGYSYDPGSIEKFVEEIGDGWKDPPRITAPFIGYMMTHSRCDSWTAMAACLAALEAVKVISV